MKRIRFVVTAALAVVSTYAIASPAPTASAVNDANMITVDPARILETRQGSDYSTTDGEMEGGGRVGAGDVVALPVRDRAGVSDDASAVFMNVTAIQPDANGYLTVYPCDSKNDRPPPTSNVNYVARTVAPNAVLSQVGPTGLVCIYSTANTDIAADISGFVPAGGAPVPMTPARLVETRTRSDSTTIDNQYQGQGRLAANSTLTIKIAGRGGVPADAQQVMLNITAVQPNAPGFLTVFPCTAALPEVSTVNYRGNDVNPNAAVATLNAAGELCVYTLATTDLIIDVAGYLPPGGNRQAITPNRCADSRDANTPALAKKVYVYNIAGGCGVPADATALYLNVTAVQPAANGYITVAPCTPAEDFRTDTSNVNYYAGITTPNAVLTKVTTTTVVDGEIARPGSICISSTADTHVLIDVVGYVPGSSVPTTPTTPTIPVTSTTQAPTQAPFITNVSAGGSQTCAVRGDKNVVCWGNGIYQDLAPSGAEVTGRFLPGTGTWGQAPTKIEGTENSVQTATGAEFACALKSDGSVWCWGSDAWGQRGNGADGAPVGATPVTGLSGVKKITASSQTVCALRNDGTVWCWGQSSFAESPEAVDVPQQITGLPDSATDVAMTQSTGCVTLANQGVACWGSNDSGSLGMQEPDLTETPITNTVTNAISIVAGWDRFCVLRTDTGVQCWGSNSYGSDTGFLGANSELDESYNPLDVVGLSDVVQLAGGGSNMCARKADGTVWCWGDNEEGQIGDGTTTFRAAPVQRNLPEKATSVAVSTDTGGLGSSCVTVARRGLLCNGYNSAGRIIPSIEAPNDILTPVWVPF